ncbi:MAG: CoA ester lyase [Neisseria sp.]|nr:CoA ester lyase [Neisseria sp.]
MLVVYQFIESYLFVPANRLDKLESVRYTLPNAIILDWEDAIAPEDKARVRAETLAQLPQLAESTDRIWVRINAYGSEYYADDIAALLKLNEMVAIQGVVLPKTETQTAIEATAEQTGKPVLAQLESAAAWLALPELAKAKGLFALTFGCLDLARELGIKLNSEAGKALMNRLRGDLLLHSKANGLPAPIESVYPDFQDKDGFIAHLRNCGELGFGGALCIHPRQVSIVQYFNTPNDEEWAFAKKVVKHYQATQEAVFEIDGKMVDKPVIEAALELHERIVEVPFLDLPFNAHEKPRQPNSESSSDSKPE